MKRLLIGALLLAGLVGAAYAEDDMSVQIDETFTMAKTWLSRQNLTLTGSPSGRDDNAAFSQEPAPLAYAQAFAIAERGPGSSSLLEHIQNRLHADGISAAAPRSPASEPVRF